MASQLTLMVHKQGPLVEGHAEPIVEKLLAGAVAEGASYTMHEVLMQLGEVLQHPTGYYESQVRAERVTNDLWSVNDGGVIYGPWLEGTGSRNAPVTRFAGYHTFRIVRNRMAQRMKAIIAAHLDRAIKEL
jgi:glutamate-1-semialdehyde aminotransferase